MPRILGVALVASLALSAQGLCAEEGNGKQASPFAIPAVTGCPPPLPPYKPSAPIRYVLPSASDVTILVVDARGTVVRRLLRRQQDEGLQTVSWDGRTDAGRPLPVGAYFVAVASDYGCDSMRIYLRTDG